MDASTLARCTGARIDRAQRFLDAIAAAMTEYGIDTPARQAAFLAQIGHESEGLHYTVEIWGPTEAQKRYEGRKDLGNTQPGDGFKFRGRGLLQITGRANYEAARKEFGVDVVANPELLGQPVLASRSSCHFWQSNGLNRFADSGDFVTLTKRINGGTNGLANRQILWAAAKAALGVS